MPEGKSEIPSPGSKDPVHFPKKSVSYPATGTSVDAGLSERWDKDSHVLGGRMPEGDAVQRDVESPYTLSKEERKAEKKRLKKLEQTLETGTLTPWQRYRVLTDTLEQYTDIVEMADRKTRFALVILGAVNAVNLVVMVRPTMFSADVTDVRAWITVYGTTYVALSLYLFVQAIAALKPRASAVLDKVQTKEPDDRRIVGLRFVQNALEVSRRQYYERWSQASLGDVNHEIAISVQMFARIITSKYQALNRLYVGLLVLVFLTAGMLATLVSVQLW